MIDQLRQLAIGLDLLAHEIGDYFFVGHGQHHIALGLILKTAHFRAHLVPAPGLLPDIGRMHHRHADFLAADGIHFFADDVFDFAKSAFGQGQIRENTAGQLADETTAQQQLVARHFGIGRILAQSLAEQLTHSHAVLSP